MNSSVFPFGAKCATSEMVLDAKQYGYRPFKHDSRRAYFVNGRKNGMLELVQLFGCQKLYVDENFPNATLCYRDIQEQGFYPKKEWYYDIACPELISAVLQLPDGRKINAVYFTDLKPACNLGLHQLCGEFVSFCQVDQSIGSWTMESFISWKVKNGKVSCWIAPDARTGEWKVIPCFAEPPAPKCFITLWNRMTKFSYGKNDYEFFGIVVFPGKILVERILVDCPKDFHIGSTYICRINDTVISTSCKSHVLAECKPFEVDSDLIEIYVDDDGKILIKTVVGAMGIPKIMMNGINQYQNDHKGKMNHIRRLEDQQPQYNVVMHPFFGKIILPRNLVWSAAATQIIFTYLFNAIDDKITRGRAIPFALAVHDGFNMVRLPIHLKTTIPSIKLLAQNCINLKEGMIDEREDELEFLPMLPYKGYQVDSSVLSRKLSKPNEIPLEKDEPLVRMLKEETHVFHHCEQNPRQQPR